MVTWEYDVVLINAEARRKGQGCLLSILLYQIWLYLQVTWSDLHILHTANVHIQFLHMFQTIFHSLT